MKGTHFTKKGLLCLFTALVVTVLYLCQVNQMKKKCCSTAFANTIVVVFLSLIQTAFSGTKLEGFGSKHLEILQFRHQL